MSPKKGKPKATPKGKLPMPEGWALGEKVWNSFSAEDQAELMKVRKSLRAEHQLTPEQLHRRVSPFDRRIPLSFERALGKKDRALLDKLRKQSEAERRAAQQAPRVMRLPLYITKFNPKDPRTKPPHIGRNKPSRGNRPRGR